MNGYIFLKQKCMKKIFLFLITIVLPVLGSADPLKVGIILPLSGSMAEYGASSRNAIEMAKEKNPDLFKSVEFFYEDSSYQGPKTISAYRSLRTNHKVDYIYVWGTTPSEVIAPIAEREKIPLLAVSCSPSISKEKHYYVIQYFQSCEEYGKALANESENLGWKKIGVIKTEITFFNLLIDGIRNNLKKEQEVVFIESVDPSTADFKDIITRIKAKNIDTLGILLLPGQVSTVYRQLAEQGLKYKTFGSDVFESRKEVIDSRGEMFGAVYPNIDVAKKFHDEYVARYKNDVQISYAGHTYDFVQLLAEIASKNSVINADVILTALRGVKDRGGVTGKFSYDEKYNYFRFPIKVKTVDREDFKG